MEQLLLALDFFQRKKVIHRDIKLDNILIKQIIDK
jgi:serine/threonine protein kinase